MMYRIWETEELIVDLVPVVNPTGVVYIMCSREHGDCITVTHEELLAFAKHLLIESEG